MSGLEALGLTCNILQLISFAGETVRFCKTIYQGSAPNEDLVSIAASLKGVSDEIQNHCQTQSQRRGDDRTLVEAAKKCNVIARALDEEVKFITLHQKKGDLIATLRVAMKSNWRKSRLDRLERSLQDHQRTMETLLLKRVW
jgi:hypothetical protein